MKKKTKTEAQGGKAICLRSPSKLGVKLRLELISRPVFSPQTSKQLLLGLWSSLEFPWTRAWDWCIDGRYPSLSRKPLPCFRLPSPPKSVLPPRYRYLRGLLTLLNDSKVSGTGCHLLIYFSKETTGRGFSVIRGMEARGDWISASNRGGQGPPCSKCSMTFLLFLGLPWALGVPRERREGDHRVGLSMCLVRRQDRQRGGQGESGCTWWGPACRCGGWISRCPRASVKTSVSSAPCVRSCARETATSAGPHWALSCSRWTAVVGQVQGYLSDLWDSSCCTILSSPGVQGLQLLHLLANTCLFPLR